VAGGRVRHFGFWIPDFVSGLKTKISDPKSQIQNLKSRRSSIMWKVRGIGLALIFVGAKIILNLPPSAALGWSVISVALLLSGIVLFVVAKPRQPPEAH
jgi:hypothetical protein